MLLYSVLREWGGYFEKLLPKSFVFSQKIIIFALVE